MSKIKSIDLYQARLFSKCRQCKKKTNEVPHSCIAYPKRDGIPVEVWNAETDKCEYFETKDEKQVN